MKKAYFKDFYGCSASIKQTKNGYLLTVCDGYGRRFLRKTYSSERGARISLGRTGDGWREL